MADIQIQNIYTLTPMQEGMLFHWLSNREDEAYFEQMSFTVKGEFDIQLFKRSLDIIIDRYDTLRTVFVCEDVEQPLQIVLKTRQLDMGYHDISALNQADRDLFIEDFKARDRKKGFNLSEDLLVRVSVLKLDTALYSVILSHHHIIMDGWCMGIITTELFASYQALKRSEPVALGSTCPFGSYIQWLEKQDKRRAAEYWSNYLEGYTQQASVPGIGKYKAKGPGTHKELCFTLDEAYAAGMAGIARTYGVTLNTVFLTIWGILLQRYNGSDDVVFGSVVSGRTPEVAGIENMVGLLINTVPVRVRNDKPQTFCEMLMRVHGETISSKKYEYFSLARIQSASELKQGLMDNIVVFENYPLEKAVGDSNNREDLGFTIDNVEIFEKTNYDFNIIVLPGAELQVKIKYNDAVYDGAFIQKIEGHLGEVIKKVMEDPETAVDAIEITTQSEKDRIFFEFNHTSFAYPEGKPVHKLFEEQVERTPENIAVIYGGEHLTYRELNKKANRLAWYLNRRGMKENSVVGIMVQRSLELVIGIMGILKAGAAYLPIDPDYPEDRISYLLSDAKTSIMLTGKNGREFAHLENSDVIHIADVLDDSRLPEDNPDIAYNPEQLMYVLYTSGSTGKPKGSMIKSHSFVNLLDWFTKEFGINSSDRILLIAPMSFDLAQKNLYSALITGGRLYLYFTGHYDYNLMSDMIRQEGITLVNCAPSAFYPLVDFNEPSDYDKLKSLRAVFLGGETINFNKLSKWTGSFNYSSEIVNTYGPTECTDIATFYRIDNNEINHLVSAPIGKPIQNVRVFILDKSMNLLPVCIPGELYIAGTGVGRGYFNNPGLTEERFKEVPWLPNEKIYRTGDLARWTPDGNIEFLGRADYQVKVRGFRIEPEEIEARLLSYEGIRDAAVVAGKDDNGGGYLCAYFVSDLKTGYKELAKHLSKELPDYMIPAYFVRMEALPLTPNGKLDRSALPIPDKSTDNREQYQAPANEMEKLLASIWSQVLGISNIGINDNYFALGGDSIKAIQIVSQLQRQKFKLEIEDLFQHPTIGDSHYYIKPYSSSVSQEAIEGEVEMLPIQRWFFRQGFHKMHHWNQAVMLYSKTGFDELAVRRVFGRIVEHHDALRMVFKSNGSGITQYNRGIGGELYDLRVVDLTGCEDYTERIKREADIIQAGINLSTGPLVKLGLFKTRYGDHLLITIHHLVVDGVSWRIILEDFTSGYFQARDDKEIEFQDKTCSFRTWAESLKMYSCSSELLKELDYWAGIEAAEISVLPRDNSVEERKHEDSVIYKLTFTDEETNRLLRQVNRAYNTDINDILIAALTMAVTEWGKCSNVLINLEGHGREEIIEGLDIKRTVGWFTTQYPVLLDIPRDEELSYKIKLTKEILRGIPAKGIGYGILRYLTPQQYKEKLEFKLEPEICFNYLGQFDEDIKDNGIEISDISAGSTVNSESQQKYALYVDGMVLKGRLGIGFYYNRKEYGEKTIESLAEIYRQKLCAVIDHCTGMEKSELTPSDVQYGRMKIREFDNLCRTVMKNLTAGEELSNVYALSPMQQGMLFHSLMEKGTKIYFEQISFHMDGNIELHVFEESFNVIIQRHDALRTVFVYEGVPQPLQAVVKKRPMHVYYEDISCMDEKLKEEYIQAFKEADKEKGFDLLKDFLMRISVLKEDSDSYTVIWSFHHIIMDGWCSAIILMEFFEIYYSMIKNKAAGLGRTYPYANYIKWLENHDKKEMLDYWRACLQGYEQRAVLPGRRNKALEGAYLQKDAVFTINRSMTESLQDIAIRNNVTLNSVIQTIWGILLQAYNNTDDVLFGLVMSGRPSELDGADSMVGLFINTIPVRLKCSGEELFSDVVKKVQQFVLKAEKNSFLTLAEIQENTALKHELIQHIMVFESYRISDSVNESNSEKKLGFAVNRFEIFEQTNYDFNVVVLPGREITVKFNYNADAYDVRFIEKIEGHLKQVIKRIIKDPSTPVKDISVLTAGEENQILAGFNNTSAPYPKDKPVQQMFEEQAERTPESIAVIFEGKTLTYRELNRKSNRLAVRLRKNGVGRDTIVAVMAERSIEMMVGIMGILKAGGAYLPIDPNYPSERIRYMLEDSGAVLILTRPDAGWMPPDMPLEMMDLGDESIYEGDGENLERINTSKDIAYVIYTSGSTGKPKGAVIEHYSLVNRLNWMQKKYPIQEGDVILQKTPYTFDVSVWELFWWSFAGAAVCFLVPGGEKDPGAIVEAVDRNKITTIHFVPSMLNAFLEYIDQRQEVPERLKSLKQVFASGEALGLQQVQSFHRLLNSAHGTALTNLYGPTEATVDVSYFDCPAGEALELVPIGKPIDNISLYIVDEYRRLQPVGVAGELCIAGDGLARGYLNRPELTEEKFVADPFAPGRRMYRTGDLARWLPDGNIEYLGRMDHQVKIRGFRIELGEIEEAIRNYPYVREAAVLPVENGTGEAALAAYIVNDRASAEFISGKRRYRLPDNMAILHQNKNETDFMYKEIFEDRNYLRHGITIKEGDCVFDAGANIGLFTLFASRWCRDIEVYSFEPIPQTFEILSANVELYGRNVKLFNCGLSNRAAMAEFTFYPNASIMSGYYGDAEEDKAVMGQTLLNQYRKEHEETGMEYYSQLLGEKLRGEKVACELKTISDIIRENKVGKIDLLKIDVEKSEMDVLEGIEDEHWPIIRQLVIEVHDLNGQMDRVVSILERQGFKVAADEDFALEGTGLYTVYASRECEAAAGAEGSSEERKLEAVEDNLFSSDKLLSFLKSSLPSYMIPSYFIQLESMPLTPSGKLDRKALPRPGGELDTGEEYAAPAGAIEMELAEIWKEVLGIDRVGVNDNFFRLGGHSLKATALVSKIHKRFDMEIPLKEVFDTPTVKGLAACIKNAGKNLYSTVNPVEQRDYYPVSSAQKRLYILNRLEGAGTSYNIPGALLIEGSLDKARLEEALRQLVSRHEAFRTSFDMINGEPVQIIHNRMDFEICSMEAGQDEVEDRVSWFIRPFDLGRAPLLRVGLVKVSEDKNVLVFDMHHIISDGASMQILVKEFAGLYQGGCLPELRIQYKDFSEWQNEFLKNGAVKAREQYWLDTFEGEIPVLDMPADYTRPSTQSFEGDVVTFECGERLAGILRDLAAATGTTLYMVMLAAYNVLLSKYTGQEDIVVGSPVEGRRHADLENIIGVFVNTLAMRNCPQSGKTFREFLDQVRQNSLMAYENQDCQFEEIIDKLNIPRDLSRNPLFDTMLVMQNLDADTMELEGLRLIPYEVKGRAAKFDLTLYAVEEKARIRLIFEYCTKLFRKETIERLAGHFINILGAVAAKPEIRLSDIEMLTIKEKNTILVEFNNTKAEYPKGKTVHQMFQEQVEQTPDRTAIVFGDRKLTYRELNERANMLARLLREKGVGRDTIAGIMVERSLEMLIGIMGILKAGGAYLPISPAYPQERVRYMLEDSGAKVLLTQAAYSGQVLFDKEVINLEDKELYDGDGSNLEPVNRSSDLAYVIYTSGSTGRPKGTMIEHYSVINRLNWMQKKYPIGEKDTILQKTPYTFDVSVWELFWWSFAGARVCFLEPGGEKDPDAIIRAVEGSRITTMHFVPSMLKAFMEHVQERGCAERLSCLRRVFASGEALGPELVEKFNSLLNQANGTTLHNLYGPTEATVDVSYFDCPVGEKLRTVPIGKPIDNISLYILDRNNKPLPAGVKGELWIAGDGLARGYLHMPELTNERFVPNPFVPGQRMYRTGDLAKWLPDGNIEYIGRIDHQVKIRGFRIELGEIECLLMKYDAIKEAVVIDREDVYGGRSLCAYIVSGVEMKADQIREYLSKELPGYMIPSYFVQLDRIPLTANGKVDRKALPQPGESVYPGVEYSAPTNETEERLAGIWRELFGMERISINDNFFDLGGHSLKATALVSRIHKEFNTELPLTEVFRRPTVKGLAGYIESARVSPYLSIQPVAGQEHYPASSAQKRMYLFNRLDESGTGYNMPGVVMIAGALDRKRIERAFEALVWRHEALRTSFEYRDGEIVQKVHREVDFKVGFIKIEEDRIWDAAREFIKPFDLGKAPLLRVSLAEINEEKHVLMFDMHHIISDGASMTVLIKEFTSLYRGSSLPELRIQYKDFTVWQNGLAQSEAMRKQEQYWLNVFKGDVPVLNMPTDFPRPPVRSTGGGSIVFEQSRELAGKLKAAASETGTTLYIFLLAAYNVLLHRYTGQKDIVVGTPVEGRNHADLENMIGMFVNTLAMRNKPGRDMKFSEFLENVRHNTFNAFENQDYQLEELVSKLKLKRDLSRNPLFDTVLIVQSSGMPEEKTDGLEFTFLENEYREVKHDMVLQAAEAGEKLEFRLDYCLELFKKETMERFLKDFVRVVETVVKNKDIRINDIETMDEAEMEKIASATDGEQAEIHIEFDI